MTQHKMTLRDLLYIRNRLRGAQDHDSEIIYETLLEVMDYLIETNVMGE